MSEGHSSKHIIQSLVANLVISLTKLVAAVLTGSGAMLAETIHSFSDCGNQLLLLLGIRQAAKAPDESHPLGYGRALYFWSFMVALLLFLAGGVFSIYEGVHKMTAPEPVERVWVGLAVLLVSLAIEGAATVGNVLEINRRRGDQKFLRYLRSTKDSDLIVVFGENAAAVVGLLFALLALSISAATDDGRWDGAGSFAVGLVLVNVAIFLAVEIKSLLVGESADPLIETTARDIAIADPRIESILGIMTLQQGAGEVLVALKVRVGFHLGADQVCETINDFEIQLRKKCPEVKWIFVEPDIQKEGPRSLV